MPTANLPVVTTPCIKIDHKIQITNTDSICSNFFAERVINIWNSLSVTVDFFTLKSFRTKV